MWDAEKGRTLKVLIRAMAQSPPFFRVPNLDDRVDGHVPTTWSPKFGSHVHTARWRKMKM
eukprot:5679996-Prymnesium_polylepis.1